VLARTDTAWLFAFVDHTQITKAASWPALTLPALESGWTRTHSCGVTFFFGLVEVGLGFGLGELEVALGVGEGEVDGEVVLGVGEGEVVVDDFGSGVPEDDVAVALDEGLSVADVLGEADPLLLADVLGEADEFADLNGDEELASAAASSRLVALFVADDSAVLFGMSLHSVVFLVV
jgi:hypothetical protein